MAEYIEREALLSAAKGYDWITGLKTVLKRIPAADVRPVVQGTWRPYSPLTDTYECDKCGYQVIDESFRTNFCPNCGADMRAEEGE